MRRETSQVLGHETNQPVTGSQHGMATPHPYAVERSSPSVVGVGTFRKIRHNNRS
jgi:hypothetical protein